MEEQEKSQFVLSINELEDEEGKPSYYAAEMNSGIPLEQVITITRMWLKKTEKLYFEKFHDHF